MELVGSKTVTVSDDGVVVTKWLYLCLLAGQIQVPYPLTLTGRHWQSFGLQFVPKLKILSRLYGKHLLL
jgi:hypothetical protein